MLPNDDSLCIIHLSVVEEGKSRIFVLLCMLMNNCLHILEQRIGYTQQIQVKANLGDYKYEKNGILSLVCPCASGFIVRVGFIHHDRMTSYNL